jgi:ParB family chromosome partitioning protein
MQEPGGAAERTMVRLAAKQTPVRLAQGLKPVSRRLHVEMDGQDYQPVVNAAPAREGHLYVRPLAGGPRMSAPAASLKLLGFVAG